MKTRRSLRLGVFALSLICLSLLLSCSLLSSNDTSSNVNEASSSADAQRAAENARKLIVRPDDLDKAKAQAEQARANANELKDQADKMTAATVREHKDPNNLSVAPKTYKANQDYQKAEIEAQHKQQEFENLRDQNEKARRDLEQANAAFAAAKQRESSSPEDGSGTETERSATSRDSSIPSWAAFLTALGGLLILGLLFWLTWRMISDNHAKIGGFIREQERNQDQRSASILSEFKEIKTHLTEVQTRLARLSALVQTEQQERLVNRKQTVGSPVPPYYELPVKVQEEDALQFPTSANTLLTRLGGEPPTLKPDPLKGILVKDPDGRGQLVLVENQRVPGQLYIVPRITRFQTKEDFYNHYEQFYDCNRPEAGEVWLQEPAVVDRVDGGWRLLDKGVLEIK